MPEIPGYTVDEILGSGGYGDVFKATNNATGAMVAAKRMWLDDNGVPSSTLREISLLRILDHPNILRVRDVVYPDTQPCVYLALELMNQNLKQLLEQHQGQGLDGPTLKSYLHQVLQGILYCHRRGVFHRDLKPENLLLSEDGTVIKVADFGLARTFQVPLQTYTSGVVTLYYRAPEILLGCSKYGPELDVWSIGCIFGEMVTGNLMFPGECEFHQLVCIFRVLGTPNQQTCPYLTSLKHYNKSFPQFDGQPLGDVIAPLSPEGLQLLEAMLEREPSRRIDALQAVNHPYFA
eukprot:EG_transcript_4536